VKLVRHGRVGQERPGIVDEQGRIRDLTGVITDISGVALLPEALAKLRQLKIGSLSIIDPSVRLGACVGGVGKFICVGLNYRDHAREAGVEPPVEPVLFMKATSAINGPNDPVRMPKNSTKVDWEVELGVVIGRPGREIDENEAAAHIAGFCVVNDLSERAFQLEGTGQWVKGKSADTFAPIGPWLVTADEIGDPHSLKLSLSVNGKSVQGSSTDQMIFRVPFLVSYISRFMSLQSGDIISTGTPPGVGMGMHPPRFLSAGDRMDVAIEGLGTQHQIVVT
jgi:2,4-diketo-3-deoxy-L-fuconate hydrolase